MLLDVILDTLIDSLKMLPFLFLSYIIIEYIEHKASDKIKKSLSKSGKYGSLVGGILGAVPQCGFSVTAANLYSGRLITVGTLIAVFISTSDEMVPVLLSHPESASKIIPILLIKIIIAVIAGFLVDLILSRNIKNKNMADDADEHIHKMCKDCDCEHGIIKSAIFHTINVFAFIIIVSFILNLLVALIGQENLEKVLLTGTIFQPLIASLIGIIPNCAASVILTELYISKSISFGSIIAGLSSGSGIGLVVLFKENKNVKENLKILAVVYLIGVVVGILFDLIGVVI